MLGFNFAQLYRFMVWRSAGLNEQLRNEALKKFLKLRVDWMSPSGKPLNAEQPQLLEQLANFLTNSDEQHPLRLVLKLIGTSGLEDHQVETGLMCLLAVARVIQMLFTMFISGGQRLVLYKIQQGFSGKVQLLVFPARVKARPSVTR